MALPSAATILNPFQFRGTTTTSYYPFQTMRYLIIILSLAANVWMAFELKKPRIVSCPVKDCSVPRPGKDCSVEMKNSFGEWEAVILVHGYMDNHQVAQYLVDFTERSDEARGGRPHGSFRVKDH